MDPEGLDPDLVLDCDPVTGNSARIVLHWTGTSLREVRWQNVVAAIREFLKPNNKARQAVS